MVLRRLGLAALLVGLSACAAPSAGGGSAAPTPTVPQPTFRPTAPPDRLPRARVTRVVDGDTLDVEPGGRIRLIGIDTPEAVDSRRPVECFAREASASASALLQGRSVRLESDDTQDDRDTFGRLLRYVWLDDGPNVGRQANFEQVVGGYAHEFTFRTSYKYRDAFKQAQDFAKRYSLGLWAPGTCNGFTARPAPTPSPSGRGRG
jgi:micrococcal nuclease